MKVLDPGHSYELDNLDDPIGEVPPVHLYFVKREGEGYPGNVGHHAGTNLQEVLRVLIDRVLYLDDQIEDETNWEVVKHLRDALCLLEIRAAFRHNREFAILHDNEDDVENYPVCSKCGHIGCEGCTKK